MRNLLLLSLMLLMGHACSPNPQEVNNLIWDTPSENSMGSMPAGNGDMGINLWVEKNGDLLFYLSKTDAWSENCRLLKIGKVRLSLSPNPFLEDTPFLQELNVNDGLIHIEAGENEEAISIDVWVDAHYPVIEVDVTSKRPVHARVSTEPWRTHRRKVVNTDEKHSAYGISGPDGPDVFVERDTILSMEQEGVIWLHRNQRSIWQSNLELQGLGRFVIKGEDPLLNRTFGGLIRSPELVKTTPSQLASNNPLKRFSLSVYTLSLQTETQTEWVDQITENAFDIESKSRTGRLKDHKKWWHAFWNRSYIHLSTQNEEEEEKVFNVSRNYALQRYVNACSGRGNSPIKFNGSIFTVDTENFEGQWNGFDADYRRWGGPYWWQNTRLPYWSMLEAGDFDLMQPLFRMYREALPIRKLATETYYNHQGVFFPETMYFWGTYVDDNYGRDRSELPVGMTLNRYIRYYWQGGLEISLMMLDYYAFTKDQEFLKETLLPVVTEVIYFFDQHWERDENGKIHFEPAMALETYNTAVNPLPEIVGIHKVCRELLKLPVSVVSDSLQKQWERVIGELPEVPVRQIEGREVLAPAYEYSGKQNIENPELYAIFPYRAYGVGKEKLEMARYTFKNRAIKRTGGWQQNAIKAAYLGLADEAAGLTATNFNTSNDAFRFPTMWGPNYDWVPDQDHGSVAMIALQRMLVQYDDDKIYLLPAWPSAWDVEFKLNAPYNTIIEGTIQNGNIESLKVNPESRMKDVIIPGDYSRNDKIRYQPVNLTSEDKQVLREPLADLHKKYDPDEKMISTTINGWNYHRDAESGVFHDVRSSFGYAVKLLDLGDEQFEQRAFDIIEKTITLQDQDTASRSCGVWPYYMEEPLATKIAPIDFNWADFNGVLLLDVWMGHQSKIPEALKEPIKNSLILAAKSIQKRNVGPGYTNIAIMGTYVTYMVSHLFDIPGMQEYAGKRLQAFYDYTLSKGGFSEYNSLTYSRVALEELARMRMYITGTSEKQMLDSLNSIGWDMIARHYHKPTRQWTGPQSRSYCNFTGPTFFRLLAEASNGQIGYEKREKPSYGTSVYTMDVKLKHQIPDHLMHYFLSPEYPRTEIDLFEKEEPQIIGTCYMTDEYALSAVNRSSMWNQRRPFLAYWGSEQQPKYLQARFLRDFYDFSSATFYSSQEENRVLAGISIATNGGNKHLNIDILKEGKVSASDLRLRFEFGNVQEQDALAIPSSNHDPFSFSLEGMQFNIQLYQAVFGKKKGHWETGGDEESCWVDYVFHSGEETVFNLSEMEQAFFGFTFSMGAQKSSSSSDAPEFSISEGDLNTTWQGLSLEVPVKPHPNPKHL